MANEVFAAAAKQAQELLPKMRADRDKLMKQVAALDDEIAKYEIVAGMDRKKPGPGRPATGAKPPMRKRARDPKTEAQAMAKFTSHWPTIEAVVRRFPIGLRQMDIRAELAKGGTNIEEEEINQNLVAARRLKKANLAGRKWTVPPLPEIPAHLKDRL